LGHANGLEQAAKSGLAVLPASCVTTTTEPGASHGAELHHPVLDLADGTGTPLATGQALLNPSAQLTDATDDMMVTKAQPSAKLARSYPQVRLLATDNTALRLQDGRGRSLSPGRRGTHSRSRSPSRPALTLSPRPAPVGCQKSACPVSDDQRQPAGHHDHLCPCACSLSSSSGSAAG
jgi:hypothetical protein